MTSRDRVRTAFAAVGATCSASAQVAAGMIDDITTQAGLMLLSGTTAGLAAWLGADSLSKKTKDRSLCATQLICQLECNLHEGSFR
ncbi:hypothetical protein [Amycolatopsis thermoflava]|uniref:hypothetical protein n=1 Tax=Amycolatopsis thermoflava TaxID=84480 RepID=UPI0038231512